MPPVLNTIVEPSGHVAMNALSAAEASLDPVASMEAGTGIPADAGVAVGGTVVVGAALIVGDGETVGTGDGSPHPAAVNIAMATAAT